MPILPRPRAPVVKAERLAPDAARQVIRDFLRVLRRLDEAAPAPTHGKDPR